MEYRTGPEKYFRIRVHAVWAGICWREAEKNEVFSQRACWDIQLSVNATSSLWLMSACCGENRSGRQKGTALCLCLRTCKTAHHRGCLYTLYPAQISRQRTLNDDFWRCFLNQILSWEEITLCGRQSWDHVMIVTNRETRNSLNLEQN